ncbi:MAG: phosphatidylglycerol lysyltransferase domain-containing protein [Candidatus Saccharibacteria bacterium]
MQNTTQWHRRLILQSITIAVIGNGLVIISATLANQIHPHGARVSDTLVTLPLISGLTLVYLGTLLHRRKQAAWAATVILYTFILGLNLAQLDNVASAHRSITYLRIIVLPIAVVFSLIIFRSVFTVRSAIQNFSISLRVIITMFLIILAYGTAGYVLLDNHDFHQEISITEAAQRTVDQFNFTTSNSLTIQSRRATIFVDSLNVLSAVAVGYAVISLFQPFKARLTSQVANRLRFKTLLTHNSGDSEDFFKIWPNDKSYHFNSDHTAALSYRVQQGVALVVGDPIGHKPSFNSLLGDFAELCRLNDWLPAIIHVTNQNLPLYEKYNLQIQKIGEEAIVNVEKFITTTSRNKYFRQISNKFKKHGYVVEYLKPPHDESLISDLKQISDDWLSIPGRQERGFMLGYFSNYYMQESNLLIARDENGIIQAFINQVPTYQPRESNYDLLRYRKSALGNVNDFLLIEFIKQSQAGGYLQVNLGLCPWSGLDKVTTKDRNLIDTAMHFMYSNSNRFYSFTGLRRFKGKYEPEWRSRYMVYKGGVRGFSRIAYALNKAMNRLK